MRKLIENKEMNEYNRKRRLPLFIFVIIRMIVLVVKRQYCCELNQFHIYLLLHELFEQRRGKRDLSVFLVYLRKRACLQ